MKPKPKPIIGILPIPIDQKECGDSHIYYNYIKWFKNHDIAYTIIPSDCDNVSHVDGLFLPGNKVDVDLNTVYHRFCKRMFRLAIRENERGRYFPVWGTCLGFEQMVAIVAADIGVLTRVDSEERRSAIKPYKSAPMSYLLQHIHIPKQVTYNHHLAISLGTFERDAKLSRFFRILGTSRDRNNKEYVATIEALHYPFYGVQWHPERTPGANSIARFLKRELEKGQIKRTKGTKKTRIRISKRRPNHTIRRLCSKGHKNKDERMCEIYKFRGAIKKGCEYDL